jgi:hypothetical protein
MRARLLHPIGERQHGRRPRRRRLGDRRVRGRLLGRGVAVEVEPTPRPCDPAVQRVREAGGPVDQASYSCECGYLFRAAVSTTVICPHCGTDQSW